MTLLWALNQATDTNLKQHVMPKGDYHHATFERSHVLRTKDNVKVFSWMAMTHRVTNIHWSELTIHEETFVRELRHWSVGSLVCALVGSLVCVLVGSFVCALINAHPLLWKSPSMLISYDCVKHCQCWCLFQTYLLSSFLAMMVAQIYSWGKQ